MLMTNGSVDDRNLLVLTQMVAAGRTENAAVELLRQRLDDCFGRI